MNTHADEWFCRSFDTEFGPLPLEVLRRMVETGQLASDDLVRTGATGSWQAVRDLAEVRTLLRGAKSPERSPSATGLRPIRVQPSDRWYYQFDGRARGPLTLATLQELIASSGDTAFDVVVRQGDDAAWVPFCSLPGMSRARRSETRRATEWSATVSGPIVSPARARPSGRTLRQLVHDHRDLVIALAVWLLINSVILVGWLESYATERKYFATLRSLEAETTALQAHDGSPREWAALRVRVKKTLAPIVQDLKKQASASEPVRQHLLCAARDHFPRLVGPRTREMEELERLYKRHMSLVEQELARR
jgi:hypothetical protein